MQLALSPRAFLSPFTKAEAAEPPNESPASSAEFTAHVFSEHHAPKSTTENEKDPAQSGGDVQFSSVSSQTAPPVGQAAIAADDIDAADRLNLIRNLQTDSIGSSGSIGDDKPNEARGAFASWGTADTDDNRRAASTRDTQVRQALDFPESPSIDADAAIKIRAAFRDSSAPVLSDGRIKRGDIRPSAPSSTPAPGGTSRGDFHWSESFGGDAASQAEQDRQELFGVEHKLQNTSTTAEFIKGLELAREAKIVASDSSQGPRPPSPAPTELRVDISTLADGKATEHVPPFRVSIVASRRDAALELRLDPPELGKVTLSFYEDDAGVQRATVVAENFETLDLLRRHSDVLQRELARAGAADVQLSFSERREDSRQFAERREIGKVVLLATSLESNSAEPQRDGNTVFPGRIDRFA
ncbi:MAG: flagellar hook-length control protein FliK [Parvularculaceae bacterium]